MKIVITGGSGFLGTALVKRLTDTNHSLVILSRNPQKAKGKLPVNVHVDYWDAMTSGSWIQHVDGAEAIINLTGESLGGKRWTKKQKEILLSSRIQSTRGIVEALSNAKTKPKVLINQSAVGFYGDVPAGDVTESHPKGNDFLGDVASQWENEARKAEVLGIRVVTPRTGVVLDRKGGALPRLLLPFSMFVGGPLGSGMQWFPWIHLEDEIGALVFALENSKLSGPVNLTAPEPVTMKDFCSALGKAMHRPSWAPVPGFALKILVGEMAGPLLLGGQKVIPKKLQESGYVFKFPRLESALEDIMGR
ncbi:MAG: TIGR01777 family protein [Ignavibacteriales bacterium]|nr:TIGR01777 family protein [Ignavibacteriales bacterium]